MIIETPGSQSLQTLIVDCAHLTTYMPTGTYNNQSNMCLVIYAAQAHSSKHNHVCSKHNNKLTLLQRFAINTKIMDDQ